MLKNAEIVLKFGGVDMKQAKPSWKKTNVPWEIKKVIWQRWALGDTEKETVQYFDCHRDEYQNAPGHRDTISKVRDELLELPIDLLEQVMNEVPETRQLVEEKRADYAEQEAVKSKQRPQRKPLIDLRVTALGLESNLRRCRDDPIIRKSPTDKIGSIVYGAEPILGTSWLGQAEIIALAKVNQSIANNVLDQLRKRYPELAGITDWADLTYEQITEDLLLELKGYF